jgi:glycine dehydrogenase subunit 1
LEPLLDVITAADALDSNTACLIVQQPNFLGCVEDLRALAEAAHAAGALLIVVVEPISLGLLESPGALGADIVVGEGQPLGLAMSYGGPFLGLFACREQHIRQMPGRVVGATVDSNGRRGYVLTFQTREQHIRREKATSNICSNEALCALGAAVYLNWMGPQGLREVANACLQGAHYAARRVAEAPGFAIAFDAPFFGEFAVRCPVPAAEVNRLLLEDGIIGGYDLAGLDPALADCLLLCVTELNTRAEIDALAAALARIGARGGVVVGGTGGAR